MTRGSSAGNSSNSPTRCSRTRSRSSPPVRPTVATRRANAASTSFAGHLGVGRGELGVDVVGRGVGAATADGSACSARAMNRTWASAALACSLAGSTARISW